MVLFLTFVAFVLANSALAGLAAEWGACAVAPCRHVGGGAQAPRDTETPALRRLTTLAPLKEDSKKEGKKKKYRERKG